MGKLSLVLLINVNTTTNIPNTEMYTNTDISPFNRNNICLDQNPTNSPHFTNPVVGIYFNSATTELYNSQFRLKSPLYYKLI